MADILNHDDGRPMNCTGALWMMLQERRTRAQLLASVYVKAAKRNDLQRLLLCDRLCATITPAERWEARTRVMDAATGGTKP